ncbi:MAG: glycosyltransferase family 9 protein [Nitrospirae bacterium]|nr:glycosyltransferase family 9 protein [Nitrospirota bacterium]
MNFSGIKKILVIKLRHIGDVLLSVPVFRALRENFPEAHIAALVNSGTEEVLEASPLIDEILVFDRSIKKMNFSQKYIKEISFLRTIRRKGFDMAVDLTGGDRAAIISFISGAAYRIGHDTREGFLGKRYLYTRLAEKNDNHHTVLQNLEIVKQFGIKTDNLSVDISIPEDARLFVKKVFEKNGINKIKTTRLHPLLVREEFKGDIFSEGNAKVVHVHPTSRWLFKCWRDEYMAEVINWLTDRGITVIVTSAPDKREMEKAKRILSLVPSLVTRHSSLLVDLCGKTTIKQIAAISEVSDLFFGVDSAPMHIAAAVGTPVVALFGPSGAFHWGPWDNNISNFKFQNSNSGNPYPEKNGIQTFGIHTVIQQDWKCVPCGKDGCDGSKTSRCLTEMKTEEVINILKGNLNI